LQQKLCLDPLTHVSDDAQELRAAAIGKYGPVHFYREWRAIAAHVNLSSHECATILNRLDVLGEPVRAVRVNEAVRVQTNEFVASVTVHLASRRIGLDHEAGEQIMDGDPVRGGFEDAPMTRFRFISLR
jgi:hypothetical protein